MRTQLNFCAVAAPDQTLHSPKLDSVMHLVSNFLDVCLVSLTVSCHSHTRVFAMDALGQPLQPLVKENLCNTVVWRVSELAGQAAKGRGWANGQLQWS